MAEMNLVINKDKCIKCGLCISDCIVSALELGQDGFPQVAENGEKRCFKCQHCLAICPTGALSIYDRNPENSNAVENKINPDDLLNLMQSRRSVRQYKNENIHAETMQKLKDMLKYVPTGCNNHGLHFAIIDDVEVMNKFRDKVNQKVINAIRHKTIKAIAGKFAHILNALEKGNDVIFRGAPHMIVVSVPKNAPCKEFDPTIALSYFELLAQSMGIGTCWCGFAYAILRFMPELYGQLEIPETHQVGYVMLFGKPEIQYTRTVQPEKSPVISVKDGEDLKLTFLQKVRRILGK